MDYLSVENLSISFDTREGEIQAVKNVSFSISEGTTLGIVGESGSGKSVVCNSLLGLLPKPPARIVSGKANYSGVDLFTLSEKQLRKIRGSRIAMIFQDPMTCLNPHMTIAKQLMEPLIVHDRMAVKSARLRAIEALKEVGIHDAEQRVDNYPHEFSGGMRQRVMIAMALIKEPDILIADEPTTALDVTVQAQILELIKAIQGKRNLTVIFISHDLAVVADLADQVIVMSQGEVVENGEAKDVLKNPQHPYAQKLVAAIPKTAKPEKYKLTPSAECLLQVECLSKSFAERRRFDFWGLRRSKTVFTAVDGVSLTLRRGEILGLVGESGSGKSTLGRAIIQLQRADTGNVLFNGTDISVLQGSDLQRHRKHFQMIFQDPYASLNPRMTVYDTLAEPLRVHQIVDQSQLQQEVNRLMDEVGLARGTVRKYPHEFSGGQRQRIAIARALAMRPKLIVADEPVSALDVTIQAQVLELLLRLTKKYELSMLFISHDLSVVRYVSDRTLVMHQGRIVEEGDTEDLYHQPKHDYTKALLSAATQLNSFDSLP